MLSLLLGACVGPAPIKDYNLAFAALSAAKNAEAPRHAPGYWSRAQKAYRSAVKQYKDREYEKALASFRQARLFAERAENFTALKKMREGGS